MALCVKAAVDGSNTMPLSKAAFGKQRIARLMAQLRRTQMRGVLSSNAKPFAKSANLAHAIKA